MDDIFEDADEYVLSHWSDPEIARHRAWGVEREFQQWNIVCVPHHPFLRSVIEHVADNISNYDPTRLGVSKIGVLNTTGPIAYTKSIYPLLHLYKHRLTYLEDHGFVYTIFGAQNHVNYFRKHYTSSRAPIVKRPLIKRPLDVLQSRNWPNREVTGKV